MLRASDTYPMNIWDPARRLLPRGIKDEARIFVNDVARSSVEPAWRRTEKEWKALQSEMAARLEALESQTVARLADIESRAQAERTALAETLAKLQSELTTTNASLNQLLSILRHEDPTFSPPPPHLQVRAVGAYVPGFIESGFSICADLNAVLQVAGKELGDFRRILDFGCGCGRTTRALKTLLPRCEVYGTDIDPEAIGWVTANYHRFAEFRLAPHRPPAPFEAGYFDLIVGISVFTHLPEDMQFQWLEELRRITKPGGYLILTTSGAKSYTQLPADMQEVLSNRGFLYRDGEYGQSISLPDFYQNTFHAHSYIQREWTEYFEVIDIQSARMQTYQDTVLLRRRPETAGGLAPEPVKEIPG